MFQSTQTYTWEIEWNWSKKYLCIIGYQFTSWVLRARQFSSSRSFFFLCITLLLSALRLQCCCLRSLDITIKVRHKNKQNIFIAQIEDLLMLWIKCVYFSGLTWGPSLSRSAYKMCSNVIDLHQFRQSVVCKRAANFKLNCSIWTRAPPPQHFTSAVWRLSCRLARVWNEIKIKRKKKASEKQLCGEKNNEKKKFSLYK